MVCLRTAAAAPGLAAADRQYVRHRLRVQLTSHLTTGLILLTGLLAPVVTIGWPSRGIRRCETRSPPPAKGFDPVALVRSAEAILLVRADSAKPFTDRAIFGPRDSVYFTVLEAIDSSRTAPPATITAIGRLSGGPDFNTGTVPYRWTRPDGMSGMCYAYTYQQGGEFLLLLKREHESGRLTPYWAACNRRTSRSVA